MSDIRPTRLDGVLEIVPARFGDARGFFSETYNAAHLAKSGVDLIFVQDNHSLSARRGVLRGLHYQLAPRAQDKLIRVVRGAIFDVAVDIRRGSSTFGQWVGIELSAEKWNQLLVNAGVISGQRAEQNQATCGARMRPPGGRSPSGGLMRAWRFSRRV